jgi:disulfide bond formation protein DsbB
LLSALIVCIVEWEKPKHRETFTIPLNVGKSELLILGWSTIITASLLAVLLVVVTIVVVIIIVVARGG